MGATREEGAQRQHLELTLALIQNFRKAAFDRRSRAEKNLRLNARHNRHAHRHLTSNRGINKHVLGKHCTEDPPDPSRAGRGLSASEADANAEPNPNAMRLLAVAEQYRHRQRGSALQDTIDAPRESEGFYLLCV